MVEKVRNRPIGASVGVCVIILIVLHVRNDFVVVAVILVPLDPYERNLCHGIPVIGCVRHIGRIAVLFQCVIVRIEVIPHRSITFEHERLVLGDKPFVTPIAVVENAFAEIHLRRSQPHGIEKIFHSRGRIAFRFGNAVAVTNPMAHADFVFRDRRNLNLSRTRMAVFCGG